MEQLQRKVKPAEIGGGFTAGDEDGQTLVAPPIDDLIRQAEAAIQSPSKKFRCKSCGAISENVCYPETI